MWRLTGSPITERKKSSDSQQVFFFRFWKFNADLCSASTMCAQPNKPVRLSAGNRSSSSPFVGDKRRSPVDAEDPLLDESSTSVDACVRFSGLPPSSSRPWVLGISRCFRTAIVSTAKTQDFQLNFTIRFWDKNSENASLQKKHKVCGAKVQSCLT